jgi:hypothetical protein
LRDWTPTSEIAHRIARQTTMPRDNDKTDERFCLKLDVKQKVCALHSIVSGLESRLPEIEQRDTSAIETRHQREFQTNDSCISFPSLAHGITQSTIDQGFPDVIYSGFDAASSVVTDNPISNLTE